MAIGTVSPFPPIAETAARILGPGGGPVRRTGGRVLPFGHFSVRVTVSVRTVFPAASVTSQ